jgi:hypothetical protein
MCAYVCIMKTCVYISACIIRRYKCMQYSGLCMYMHICTHALMLCVYTCTHPLSGESEFFNRQSDRGAAKKTARTTSKVARGWGLSTIAAHCFFSARKRGSSVWWAVKMLAVGQAESYHKSNSRRGPPWCRFQHHSRSQRVGEVPGLLLSTLTRNLDVHALVGTNIKKKKSGVRCSKLLFVTAIRKANSLSLYAHPVQRIDSHLYFLYWMRIQWHTGRPVRASVISD